MTHRFRARLDDLEPSSDYSYRAGDGSKGLFSEVSEFKTGPGPEGSFSFIYFGDTQTSPGEFGQLLSEADRLNPETAFYLLAGDLVEDGEWRQLWDSFAFSTSCIFSRKPAVPALGNHDSQGPDTWGARYFSNLFGIYDDRAQNPAPGRSRSFAWGTAFFIILDSNSDIEKQALWLKNELAENSQFKFKIVMFHHPPYHPAENRRSDDILAHWVPLFDRYRADLVLTGHDHSYLRTKKMKNHQPVPDGQDGVIYLTSTSCPKFYRYIPLPQAEIQIGNTLTYQTVRIESSGGGKYKLIFKTFDRQHRLIDSFAIRKDSRS
jgi:hypothetical protein